MSTAAGPLVRISGMIKALRANLTAPAPRPVSRVPSSVYNGYPGTRRYDRLRPPMSRADKGWQGALARTRCLEDQTNAFVIVRDVGNIFP
jgi:hypothetical protein